MSSGSGRKSRTFISRFKACRPTISRSPSCRRKERDSNPQGLRRPFSKRLPSASELVVPNSSGGRGRTCNLLLNKKLPYQFGYTAITVGRVGVEPTRSGFRNRRNYRIILPPYWSIQSFPTPCQEVNFTTGARNPLPEHPAGVEPAPPAWEAGTLPLRHGCFDDHRVVKEQGQTSGTRGT